MATLIRSIAFATAFAGGLSLSTAITAFAEPALSNTALIQGNSAPALRAGDLVRVRSGGPLMTVEDIQGDRVNCSWSDWLGELKSQSFPIAALQGPIAPAARDPNAERVE
jgi:uncharacterized protein YodC (DUF2158 family)